MSKKIFNTVMHNLLTLKGVLWTHVFLFKLFAYIYFSNAVVLAGLLTHPSTGLWIKLMVVIGIFWIGLWAFAILLNTKRFKKKFYQPVDFLPPIKAKTFKK